MDPLPRVTPATLDVLRALLDSAPDTWGLQIVKVSGRPAGSVYPILDRLERAGWLTSSWEAADDRSGPRRRLYRFAPGAADAAASLIAQRAGQPVQNPGKRQPAEGTT